MLQFKYLQLRRDAARRPVHPDLTGPSPNPLYPARTQRRSPVRAGCSGSLGQLDAPGRLAARPSSWGQPAIWIANPSIYWPVPPCPEFSSGGGTRAHVARGDTMARRPRAINLGQQPGQVIWGSVQESSLRASHPLVLVPTDEFRV